LNPTTGAATTIGPIGYSNVTDLAMSPLGVLYAIASGGGSSSYIYQINSSTGAGTLVATLNVPNLMGLTYDVAGNLYATNYTANSTLYSVNLGSQSLTPIGQAGFVSHGLDAIVPSPSRQRYRLLPGRQSE
jgi:hypothetical protein